MRIHGRAPSSMPLASPAIRTVPLVALALLVANCSGPPRGVARPGSEIDPRYGVKASPRVVAEGEPVPKGGGREMVGKPYIVGGRTYVPREDKGYSREGLASWYGAAFHGRLTANGEVFDREAVAAAHPTMPLPSYARVTNLRNGRSLIVRVNDRGPYHQERLIDVSEKAADALGFQRVGTTRVRVEYVGRASTRGSDDTKLMATLRSDGRPAPFPGQTAPVLVAAAEPPNDPAPRSPAGTAGPDRERQPASANVPLPPGRPLGAASMASATRPANAMSPRSSAPTALSYAQVITGGPAAR